MKKRKTTIIMVLFFFMGLLVLLYPAISSYYNEKVGSKAIADYESLLVNLKKEDYTKIFDEAKIYNQQLSNLKEPLLEHKKLTKYK